MTSFAILSAPSSALPTLAASVPVLAVVPFVLLLLSIAVLPLVAHHWWESNRNRGIVAAVLGLPVAVWMLVGPAEGGHWLFDAVLEYVAFIALLGSLFIISGGIRIGGSLSGTPIVNTAILTVGAAVASFIGTTGASMVLIRPLLRANASRRRKAHIVVFFILVVSNAGGLLTPLGDPPLFLGFLRGVPFDWTLRLWLEWLLTCGALLFIFHHWDQVVLNREARERPGENVLGDVQERRDPLHIDGKVNFLFLLGVVATNYFVGTAAREHHWSHLGRDAALVSGMVSMAVLSLFLTPRGLRRENGFSWAPIVEVAVVFAGIFVTMVPAMKLLDALGSEGKIALTEPWQYFWVTGGLSSFLDNAPTYVTFTTIACGVAGRQTGLEFSPNALGSLAADPFGASLLAAISCGAVFMGANTYIGNGPNFMVKAIAEQGGVKMPSFFGYFLWAFGIMLPLYVAMTFLFFV